MIDDLIQQHQMEGNDGMGISKRRIFGLSIAEEIQWGFAEVALNSETMQAEIVGEIHDGIFDIPKGNLHDDGALFGEDDYFDIEDLIRQSLRALNQAHPKQYAAIEAVGVSTIGIVERVGYCLESIARKPWRKKRARHIVDFKSIFIEQNIFPMIIRNDQIVIHNDASARCKTECLYGNAARDASSVLYIMAGEGVNAAYVNGKDLLRTQRHSEMGHIYPLPHPADVEFSREVSGCPAHIVCFEGLLSDARFRRQWHQSFADISAGHIAVDIAAYYLAQMAWIGVLSLDPQRVLFGGAHFSGKNAEILLQRVRSHFKRLNNGYLPHYQTATDIDKLLVRASLDNRRVKILSALTMASMASFDARWKEPTIAALRSAIVYNMTDYPRNSNGPQNKK